MFKLVGLGEKRTRGPAWCEEGGSRHVRLRRCRRRRRLQLPDSWLNEGRRRLGALAGDAEPCTDRGSVSVGMVMLVLDRMRGHVRSSHAAQPQEHGDQNASGQYSTKSHMALPMRRKNGLVPTPLY